MAPTLNNLHVHTCDHIPVYHWGQASTLQDSREGGRRLGHRLGGFCKRNKNYVMASRGRLRFIQTESLRID